MSAPTSLAFRSPDHASLLLRLALGAMWVSHGLVLKLMTFGIDGFTGWMGLQGLPSMLAWPIVIAEIAGGIAIAVGFHGRWVSLALLPILLGATWIHAGNGWVFTAPNGGWEYPVFLVAASIAHFFLGDGAFAAKRSVAL